MDQNNVGQFDVPENKSIHDFDVNLICEYYSTLERQGPGSPEVTRQALSFIDGLNHSSRIADLGCGTGGQTLVVAKEAPGSITALDLFPAFIDTLNKNALKLGLQNRIKGVVGSMDTLPFEPGELDLIWSEGAIYNIGFEHGLTEWRKYLKPGGHVAVSELTWFRDDPPSELAAFWESEYPDMDTVSNKVAQMQKAGYVPVAAFLLPERCWTEHFYAPQRTAQEVFLKKYKGNKNAEELVANQRHEAQLYNRFKEFYGYAFYIGRKY